MFTLYATRGSGNCFKPFLAMTQLEIPFQVREVDVLQGQTKSPAYLAVNPLGAVPYLQNAAGQGVAESNAMLWWIADGTPLIPQDAYERACALQWMFFEQTRLEPHISPARFLSFIAPELGQGRAADIAAWREKALLGLGVLDKHLAKHDFVSTGTYSIGDIGVYGYVHLADEAGLDLAQFAAVARWIERVRNTPRYCPIAQLCVQSSRFGDAARP